MDPRPIRWGILGAGGIARKFVRSAQATDTPNPVLAVASNAGEKAQAFAKEMGLPQSYGSYAELLAAPDLEAVYVANLHHMHHAAVLSALRAGKHVLCEKPLAINAQQAAEMIRCAQEHRCFLMEAMWTRFLPACRQLKQWLDEGRLGKVVQIEASFGFCGTWPKEGRMRNPALAGGALLDLLGSGLLREACVGVPSGGHVDGDLGDGEELLGVGHLQWRACMSV